MKIAISIGASYCNALHQPELYQIRGDAASEILSAEMSHCDTNSKSTYVTSSGNITM